MILTPDKVYRTHLDKSFAEQHLYHFLEDGQDAAVVHPNASF